MSTIPKPADPSTTTIIQHCLDSLNAQQPEALEQLSNACRARLRKMVTVMMVKYQRLRRWVEEEDVLQEVEIKLIKALQSIEVKSTRNYFGLAATAIRRQLIDLLRKFRRHFEQDTPGIDYAHENDRPNLHPGVANHPDSREGPWEEVELHELVNKLPDDLREIFELIHYHGMSYQEVARHLTVSITTTKHKFHDAKCLLGQYLTQ